MQHTTFDTLLIEQRTPLYLYDITALRNTIASLKQAFPIPNFQLLFATMANDNPEFLKQICNAQVGACVNSLKHLNLVLNTGFHPNSIQFTSTGITRSDMNFLAQHNITVNFDSIKQLEYWFALKAGLSAGLRINTASLTPEIQIKDRLGIEKEEIQSALEIATKYQGRINGLHIYVGTNYKDPAQMLKPIAAFFDLVTLIPDLEYLNIGGGIGVNYMNEIDEFDLTNYGNNIARMAKIVSSKTDKTIRIVFEPGRRLAAAAGYFVTRITDIKYLNFTRYVVVDGSIANFPRPFHHPESPHPVVAPGYDVNAASTESIIVGRTTFSKDIFARTQLPRDLAVGDLLVFEKAGAYCESMRSRFLGQEDPEIIFTE